MHYTTGPDDLCYRFSEDKLTWEGARLKCESEGGRLANTQEDPAYGQFGKGAHNIKLALQFVRFPNEPTLYVLRDIVKYVGW